MELTTETMTLARADNGDLLVTLAHDWSPEQRIVFTVAVPLADGKMTEIRKLAVDTAVRLLTAPHT